MADNIQPLLALRDSLNASIDAYVAMSPEERSKKPKVDQARQQISRTATKLAAEAGVAQQQATLIAFQVRKHTRYGRRRVQTYFFLWLAMDECCGADGSGARPLPSHWRRDDSGSAGSKDGSR
jgi:hypothetical protein